MKPNFIYFNPDQLRADVLGCYGDAVCETPNFDRLAAMGTRFAECHVQHTVCTPSRASFLTGWYPHVRGHRSLWHTLGADEPNTFRYLKDSGYEVHVVGKNDALAPEAVPLSITRLHEVNRPTMPGAERAPPGSPHRESFLYSPIIGEHSDCHAIEECIDFLRSPECGRRPFMFFLALLLPHPPYTCPRPWYDLYRGKNFPLQPVQDGGPVHRRLVRQYRGLDRLTPEDFQTIRAVYLGMVSYLDHQLGRLLDALERSPVRDSTYFVAFSDHGDWAGDYELVEKWPSGLDPTLTRVPVIVSGPGVRPGHTVTAPVELLDLPATTLDLADVPFGHTQFGRSWRSQLAGAAGDPVRVVFTEGGYGINEPGLFEGKPGGFEDIATGDHVYGSKGLLQQEHPESVARCVAMRTPSHTLIWRGDAHHELYDRRRDPAELNNLFGDLQHHEVRDALIARMMDWLVATSDVSPLTPRPRGWWEPSSL